MVYAHANIANDIITPSNQNFNAISTWSGLENNSGSISPLGFTAPRNGVYAVQVEYYFKNMTGSFANGHKIKEAYARIMKNGTSIHDHGNGDTNSGTYFTIAMQTIVVLNLGDTISTEYLLSRDNNSTWINIKTTGTHLSVWNVD